MRLGILPLARPTFDVEFAKERHQAMMRRLSALGHELAGGSALLMNGGDARRHMAALEKSRIDRLVLLQVTFTDAAVVVEAAARFNTQMAIWAVPEPRLGGRLRLNAFCGLNLASHALGNEGREFAFLYADPDDVADDRLGAFLEEPISIARPPLRRTTETPAGRAVADTVSGKRIGCIGEHPEGFATCRFSPESIRELAGVSVERIGLEVLFEAARNQSDTGEIRASTARQISGIGQLDKGELERSLRLKPALEILAKRGKFDGFAVRCWPECFTEYGGAVCGPVAMLVDEGIPCACEADVYGSLTQLFLQEAAKAPVFLTDLVDVDVDDDSAVAWHCGQAPVSMCKSGFRPQATVHSNRKMPLLFQFPLKPGRITLMRVSQALGEPKMVLAGGEMLDRPMAFTGTSGVFRFDRPAGAVMNDIVASGLEHHVALAYGEHRPLLREVAAALDIPVLEL